MNARFRRRLARLGIGAVCLRDGDGTDRARRVPCESEFVRVDSDGDYELWLRRDLLG